jgi:hypothetical protein
MEHSEHCTISTHSSTDSARPSSSHNAVNMRQPDDVYFCIQGTLNNDHKVLARRSEYSCHEWRIYLTTQASLNAEQMPA